MKIIAQMDEISSINLKTDSTFTILLEAQNQGHEIFYYLPNDLNFDSQNQKLSANVRKLRLQRKENDFFDILEEKIQDLTNFDVILIRQDPPFNMSYVTTTYLLEKIKDQVLIINNPTEVRNCSEKIFATNFQDLCPPTIISSNIKTVQDFAELHGDTILKPLYSGGGEGITLVKKDDQNLNSAFENLRKTYKTPVLAQKYLPQITKGDKRVLIVNGKAVGGISRIASAGSVKSNLHAGGSAHKLELSPRDQEICEIVGPELKKRGLFFVGIDIIGDYLTEINVTSPTCINETNKLNNTQIEKIILEEIFKIKS